MRRLALLIAGLLTLASVSTATSQSLDPLKPDAPLPDILKADTFRLWPGRAPGAAGDAPADTPTVTVYRPWAGKSNGAAVIIAPGGGYLRLAGTLEGAEPAAWFASHGVTAFVLTYRLAPARLPAPLLDGARAVRFVRAHAAEFQINPAKIGMLGYSAGGHLVAMTAVASDPGAAASADPVERASSRPDFLILAYPWLEATRAAAPGRSPYCLLMSRGGKEPCVASDYAAYVPADHVRDDAPPTFIYHTSDDESAPAGASVRFYAALAARRVPAELHIFQSGKHGSGFGGDDPSLDRWPELLEAWMRRNGWLTRAP